MIATPDNVFPPGSILTYRSKMDRFGRTIACGDPFHRLNTFSTGGKGDPGLSSRTTKRKACFRALFKGGCATTGHDAEWHELRFMYDFPCESVKKGVDELKAGGALLLENLLFHSGEEAKLLDRQSGYYKPPDKGFLIACNNSFWQ
jgi:hypothetical protein